MLAAIVIGAPALAIYVAPLLPIVVALVTKANAHPALKAGVLAVLGAVVALVAPAVQNGTDIEVGSAFLGSLVVTLLVAVGSHFAFARPLGLSGSESKPAQVDALGPLTIG